MARILVVDDDPDWTDLLGALLEGADHDVTVVHSGVDCLKETATSSYDLVVLDIAMPGMNGHDVCVRLRARSDVLIVILTALGHMLDERLQVLAEGADEVIAKTVGAREISARVDALLRRPSHMVERESKARYHDGVLDIDLDTRMTILKRGEEISLTPTERKLLRYLMEHRGVFVPHGDILEAVWGPEYREQTTYLAVYMSYLRKKVEDDPKKPVYLLTKHRQGYGFFPADSDTEANDNRGANDADTIDVIGSD